MQMCKWVCLKIGKTPKPNGFADHYPYEKWLFHWEYIPITDDFYTNLSYLKCRCVNDLMPILKKRHLTGNTVDGCKLMQPLICALSHE